MTPTTGLTLIQTGNQCPAGLLSWPAWQALNGADRVLAGEQMREDWEPVLAAAGLRGSWLAATPADLGARLVDDADQSQVVWLVSRDGDPGLAEAITTELVWRTGRGVPVPTVQVVLGSWDVPGSQLLDLVAVMNRLRSPGGCPWDREQTHASLLPYAIEEVYELAEAIETGGRDDLVEELGDLLLQVVFHARLGEELVVGGFGIDDVAEGIATKLRRRHPHVFADVHAPTAAAVESNWEQIKKAEKGRGSVFDGVPTALPALAKAQKVLATIARAGWASAPTPSGTSRTATEFGDVVLASAEQARLDGVDAEAAVRQAVRRLVEVSRDLE
jgi:XTP/dITP diphosphohydrolase